MSPSPFIERTNALSRKIEAAWEHAEPPRPGHISKPTYDDEGVSEYFSDRSWRGHTVKQLRALDFAPTILTDEAFAYFLPAYMLADIHSPVEADTIVEALLFNLSISNRGLAIAARLSDEQKEAVVSYVAFVREREGDLYEDWCADALRSLASNASDA